MEKRSLMDEAFIALAEESKDLYAVTQIDRIENPTPIQFLRDYVSQNRPVIITGAFDHWKAMKKWTNEYLRIKLRDKEVTVDITPFGKGDAVVNDIHFVKPVEKSIKFNDFMDFIEKKGKQSHGVYYIQHQNGNFLTEFAEELSEDVDSDIAWATEVFGVSPDAVNFWMGDDRAISSVHKDHYENIYVVVAGEKHFTLLPPTDLYFLYEKDYISATYKEVDGEYVVEEDEPFNKIPWISCDPDNPDLSKYPLFKYANPVKCVVGPGECLYLPSMWFHQVSQKPDSTGRTIAVNYWYDMKYSANWCYFKFMEKVISECKRISEMSDDSKKNKDND